MGQLTPETQSLVAATMAVTKAKKKRGSAMRRGPHKFIYGPGVDETHLTWFRADPEHE